MSRNAPERDRSGPPEPGSLSPAGPDAAGAGVVDDGSTCAPPPVVAAPAAGAFAQLVLVDGDPEPLPGLDDPVSSPGRGPTPQLELSVRRTLRALAAEEALQEADAGRVALALEMAAIISEKRASRKTSTIGHDARVLLDILDELSPAPSEGDAALKAAMGQWAEFIRGQEHQPDAASS